MAYTSSDQCVEYVLNRLRLINETTQSKKPGLAKFLQALRGEIKLSTCPILSACHFLPTGSCYENTAVTAGADFDVLMILPQPYRAINFEVLDSPVPGYYKLKWITSTSGDYDDEYEDNYDEEYDEENSVESNGSDRPNFVNGELILETRKLLRYILNKFCKVLQHVKKDYPQWKLSFFVQHSSLAAFFRDENGVNLKIDFVPQIGKSNWEGLPGICSISDLPAPLADYVNKTGLQYPILFSLVPAPYMLGYAGGSCLVTTCFSMLEKYCMKESDALKDAVLLVKLLSQSRGWKKNFGLRPFHIKRVAIKHYDELDGLSSWKAFQRLLSYLSSDLHEGKIDGFFIQDQDVYLKKDYKCTSLAVQIDEAKNSVQPNNLKNCLNNYN